MLKRNLGLIAGATLVLLVAVYFILAMTNPHRQIVATSAIPEGSDVGRGTDIVLDRAVVGRVGSVDSSRDGLEVAVRFRDGLEVWRSIIVLDSGTTRAIPSAPPVTLAITRTDSTVFLMVRQGLIRLQFQRIDGGWVDVASPDRQRVRLNGKPARLDAGALRLAPDDYLGLAGIDLRIGGYRRYSLATVTFTTTQLCPLRGSAKWLPWRPDRSDQASCRTATVGGEAQLTLTSTFGLTKPLAKLTPSHSISSVIVGDTVIALTPGTDLKAQLEQMVGFLNAPANSRRAPATHFEVLVTNADSAIRSVTRLAMDLEQGMHSRDGLTPALLGENMTKALNRTLTNASQLSERLADPNGTLAENAGLRPALDQAQRTLALGDTTMRAVRGQIERLSPRVELALDRVTTAAEGAPGAVASINSAARDINSAVGLMHSLEPKLQGVTHPFSSTKGKLTLAVILALIGLNTYGNLK